jgi:hypothetical protein
VWPIRTVCFSSVHLRHSFEVVKSGWDKLARREERRLIGVDATEGPKDNEEKKPSLSIDGAHVEASDGSVTSAMKPPFVSWPSRSHVKFIDSDMPPEDEITLRASLLLSSTSACVEDAKLIRVIDALNELHATRRSAPILTLHRHRSSQRSSWRQEKDNEERECHCRTGRHEMELALDLALD